MDGPSMLPDVGDRFRVNAPSVIAETIDGEVVVIDLSSGNYYSLRDTGAVIWDSLAAGSDCAESAAVLRAAFDVDGVNVDQVVTRFAAHLRDEGLVVLAPDAEPSTASASPSAAGTGQPAPFSEPVLEAFDDMTELILLDPVHDVDADKGWPRAAPDR